MLHHSPHADGSDAGGSETPESGPRTDAPHSTASPRPPGEAGSHHSDTRSVKSVLKSYLPASVATYGRTVYGGNPVVQQTLPGIFAYPPLYALIPLFVIFMIPCVAVGASVVVASGKRYLVEVPYSQIHQYQYLPTNPAVNVNQGIRSFVVDGVTHTQGTVTWVEFPVTQRMRAPVYMYYMIDNLYQNSKDFYMGRSITQLMGQSKVSAGFNCKPYEHVGYLNDREGDDVTVTYTTASGQVVRRVASDFTYNPCGIAPWSKFNDTLRLYRVVAAAADADVMGGDAGTTPLTLICDGADFDSVGNPLGQSVAPNRCAKKGISWRSDTNVRFGRPALRDDWWSRSYPHVTDNDYLNQGWYLNEPGHALPDAVDLDLQVWLKSAVLPRFRKLYRILDVDLEPGTYMLQVDEFFDVVSFRGSKGLVLRTTSWVGDSNVALGVVLIVVGCLSFVLGIAFAIEYALKRCGLDRVAHLPQPKRDWYYFDPEAPEMKDYYELRMRRHIPVADLQLLRTQQQYTGGASHRSEPFEP